MDLPISKNIGRNIRKTSFSCRDQASWKFMSRMKFNGNKTGNRKNEQYHFTGHGWGMLFLIEVITLKDIPYG